MAENWILTPRPNRTPRVRLVCVPGVGGGVRTFRGWPERVPAADVGIVQLPGRGSRLHEPLLQSLPEAADRVTDAIGQLPACPTVLLGHGLGALIAFETARRLQALGWPLLALFVSGRRAPGLGDPAPRIAHLPAEAFILEVRRRYGALLDDVFADPELMPLLLPALRADYAMEEAYRYEQGAPLGCPVIACGGVADALASRADLEEWRSESRVRFSLHTFRGAHVYIQEERGALTTVVANHVSVLVGAMARRMGTR